MTKDKKAEELRKNATRTCENHFNVRILVICTDGANWFVWESPPNTYHNDPRVTVSVKGENIWVRHMDAAGDIAEELEWFIAGILQRKSSRSNDCKITLNATMQAIAEQCGCTMETKFEEN